MTTVLGLENDDSPGLENDDSPKAWKRQQS